MMMENVPVLHGAPPPPEAVVEEASLDMDMEPVYRSATPNDSPVQVGQNLHLPATYPYSRLVFLRAASTCL